MIFLRGLNWVLLFWGLSFPMLAFCQFKNISPASGILHHHAQEQMMGGGAAFIDFDQDGWLDILVTGGDQPDKLYRNKGDNKFEDASSLLPHDQNPKSFNSSAVIAGDLNNDGCDDLVITTYTTAYPNLFLKNNCDGTFRQVFPQGIQSDTAQSIGGALIDYDRDGLLDIYIINYLDSIAFKRDEQNNINGFAHRCGRNLLYRNLGDFEFEELGEQLEAQGKGCALAVAAGPFYEGKPSLYIANDFGEDIEPNEFLVFESAPEKFIDLSLESGLDIGLFGMGVAPGDFDNDLDIDFYVTNMGANAFMVNDSNFYTNQAPVYSLENTYTDETLLTTGWGTFFFDSDNDSDLDLFVANGFLPSARFLPNAFIDPSKLFENIQGQYYDVSKEAQLEIIGPNRGAIYGDTDNDGDLDILLTNIVSNGPVDYNSTYKLMENKNSNANHFIDIELAGTMSNRNAFGAQVYIYHSGKVFLQQLYSGGTFASQSSRFVHFGLGKTSVVDSLKVIWPNGLEQMHYQLPIDQKVWIEERNSDFAIIGCTNLDAENFNPEATLNRGCIELITNTDELEIQEPIQIFPTITQGKLFLKIEANFEKVYLQVNNNLGQVIQNQEIRLNNSLIKEIELATSLQNGLYWMSFYDEAGKRLSSSRFILQR